MRASKTRSEWEGLLAAQRKSGLSDDAFCARHGIGKTTLRWWRSRLRRHGQPSREPGVKLVAVDVVAATSTPAVDGAMATVNIWFRDVEVRIQGMPDVVYVAALVAELRSRC
jgi:transposase-like protein